MRTLVSILVLPLYCLSATCAVADEESGRDFITMTRVLFAAQDATAYGDTKGIEGQRRAVSALTNSTLPELSEFASDPAIVYAFAAYVLSGGRPADAEAYARSLELDDRSRQLLQGAAAYMRGNLDDARTGLASVDPLALPPAYGGRVALTKAMLADAQSVDRERHLSVAMALMPGTLIEEAALRRSALSFAERGDAKQFWRRTERYIRRFPKSIYAADFLSGVTDRIIELYVSGRSARLDELDRLYATLPVNRRRQLYLQLARGATAANVPELAQLAGRHLFRLAVDGSVEQALGTLYTWAYAVTDHDFEPASERLYAIDRHHLGAMDRAILDAALEMIRLIRAPAGSPASIIVGEDEVPEGLRLLQTRASIAVSSADELLSSQ